MRRKQGILLGLLMSLAISTMGWAQDPVLDWAVTIGDTSSEEVTAVAVDESGNVYSAGRFRGTVDFDPGPGTFELTAINVDLFIQKLDADGDFVWAGSYGTTGNGNDVYDIAVDDDGAVYLTGSFHNTADFDPGVGTTELTSAGSGDVYVLKLDASGGIDWVRQMGGTTDDNGTGIAVDAAGNVYTTGNFTGTADFDPGSGTSNLTSGGDLDAFVSKLDADGDFVWAASNSGSSTISGNAVQVDPSGNVYTCGFFHGTVDFDPGVGTDNIAAKGSSDVYVQKLDSSGGLVWIVKIGGGSSDTANDLFLDAAGNLYTTGRHRGNGIDFDPGAGTFGLSNAGLSDIFVQKMDTDTVFAWAIGMGGTGFEEGNAVAVDAVGNVYIAGKFEDTVDFDPGAGTTELISAGDDDGFVCKLDATGALTWARTFGSTGADGGGGIAVHNDDSVTVGGWFTGTVDFDPTAATQNATSGGGQDAVVFRLRSQFAPVANDDTGTTGEDAVLSIVNGSDSSLLDNDTDENAGDTLTIDSADTTSTEGATVTENADGTFTYDPTAALALQALNDGDSVVDTFGYTVTDGIDTDTATVSITVNGADEDTTPPAFTDLMVTPSEVLPGADVTITFDVSEALLGDPTVTVDGDPATLLGVSKAGATYTYGYTLPESAIPGAVTIAINGVDLAGNPGSLTTTSALSVLDAVPPAFTGVVVAPAEALPGQDVTITFEVSEALLGDPVVTVDGDPANLLGVAKAGPTYTYTYGYTIPSGAAPGSPEIAISGVDLAGNPGSLTSTALLTIVSAVPLFAGPVLIVLALAGALYLRRRAV